MSTYHPRTILFAGLASIACLFSSGCSGFQKLEDFPPSVCTQSTLEALNDPELTALYKSYFPEGKPNLSYRCKTKKARTRLFINPKANLKQGLDYEVIVGVEVGF